MNKIIALSRLNRYNITLAKYRTAISYKQLALKVSIYIHIIMLIPFAINSVSVNLSSGLLIGLPYIPIIKDIPTIFPLYCANVKYFIICSIISLYIFPLLIAVIIIIIGNIVKPKIIPLDETKSLIKLADDLKADFGDARFHYKGYWFIGDLIVSFVIISFSSTAAIINKLPVFDSNEIYMYIFHYAVCLIISFIISLLITSVFRLLQIPIALHITKKWKLFRQVKNDCETLVNTLLSDIRKENEAKLSAKKSKADKKNQERLKQLAINAEIKFKKLKSPKENIKEVEALANNGSPSACDYLGKVLYFDYLNKPHTKKEKVLLISKI